jgi:hypothetical protein
MRFEYELIVFCGIIALGVVHLIDMRLQWLKYRKTLRARTKNGSAEQGSGEGAQPSADAPLPAHGSRNGKRFHRFVMTLLILALIWSGILVWVEA